jgi:hypothetical protein
MQWAVPPVNDKMWDSAPIYRLTLWGQANIVQAMQIDVADLLRLIDEYCRASEAVQSDGGLSKRMFNDGKRIRRLRAGGEIGSRSLKRALQWLSDHWPGQAVWPDTMERPTPKDIGSD